MIDIHSHILPGLDDGSKKAFQQTDKVGLFTQKGKESRLNVLKRDRPVPVNNVEMIELVVEKKVGTEHKTFVLRVLKKKGDDRMFVVVAGTRQRNFARLEPQLRELLNTFRILDANQRRD